MESEDYGYRELPNNLEAEQGVLGAILANNAAWDRVSNFLEPRHFHEGVHSRIYEAAATLIKSGRLANPITLKSHFERDDTLIEIGGVEYLARLVASATTIINIEEYARTVHELASRRKLIELGTDIVNGAYDPPFGLNARDLIEQTEQQLYEAAEPAKYGHGFVTFDDALRQAIEMASNAYQRDGGLSGISCGLADIDDKMGGLQPSDLIILAGRPAMGKSALATNIAYHVAKAGHQVAFFSLEMSAEQLATRIMAEQAGIPSERIRRGKIDEREFNRLIEVARERERMPIHIDPTGGLTIGQLSARTRRIKRQKGLGLVVVDYLQLLAGQSKRMDNRVQEVTAITVGLKALAKEMNVPVLALSQLSRQVESRDDKRPQLADLRESGSIEQDADVVLFIFREEYYLSRAEPRPGTQEHLDWQTKMHRASGIAEIIIGKQRHGPTGVIPLQFEAALTRFSNLAPLDRGTGEW